MNPGHRSIHVIVIEVSLIFFGLTFLLMVNSLVQKNDFKKIYSAQSKIEEIVSIDRKCLRFRCVQYYRVNKSTNYYSIIITKVSILDGNQQEQVSQRIRSTSTITTEPNSHMVGGEQRAGAHQLPQPRGSSSREASILSATG